MDRLGRLVVLEWTHGSQLDATLFACRLCQGQGLGRGGHLLGLAGIVGGNLAHFSIAQHVDFVCRVAPQYTAKCLYH